VALQWCHQTLLAEKKADGKPEKIGKNNGIASKNTW